MKKSDGITLIEVLIVIAVIGVLAVALAFEFTGWIGDYRVESQIKEMHVDLMNTRARAMQRNRTHFVSLLSPTSYTVYEDDSDGTNKVPDGDGELQTGAGDSADTELPSFPKTVDFRIDWNNSPIEARRDLEFDRNGLTTNPANLGSISIFVDRNNDGEQDFFPYYDCIIIAQTRINMGKLDVNGTPNRADDECVAK